MLKSDNFEIKGVVNFKKYINTNQIVKEIIEKENDKEVFKMELSIDEWDAVNSILWSTYNNLCDVEEITTNPLEKLYLNKFLDKLEPAIRKINDCCN